MRTILKAIILVTFLSICLPSSGGEPILVDANKLDLQPHFEYLIDESNNADIQSILNLPPDDWSTIPSAPINFGFDNRVYWFRISLESYESKKKTLEVAYPSLDFIDYFLVKDNQVEIEINSGDHLPFSERHLERRVYTFPLQLNPEQPVTVYFKVQTQGSMKLPAVLWELNTFVEAETTATLIHGMFFGIMTVMFLYNLFLCITLRNISFLFYVGLIFCSTLFVATFLGFSFKYIWPNSMKLNEAAIVSLPVITGALSILFSRSFLSLAEWKPRIDKFFIWIGVFFLFYSVLVVFIPYRIALMSSLFYTIFFPVTLLSVGIISWLNGNISARYFTIAWFSILIGMAIIPLNAANIVPVNFLTDYSYQMGATLEVILLSLAIGHSVSEEKSKRIAAQQETLDLHLKTNKMLLEMSHKDSLTGLHNRRAFDERFYQEWRREKRSQQPLGIIMIDIDNFKTLNDTLGHLMGDEIIRQAAEEIKASIRRPADFCARFGGDEFVVLLPDTKKEDLLLMAESIRQNISQLVINFEQQQLYITASLGCYCYHQDNRLTPEEFISGADKALYKAKQLGRNRSEMFNEQNSS